MQTDMTSAEFLALCARERRGEVRVYGVRVGPVKARPNSKDVPLYSQYRVDWEDRPAEQQEFASNLVTTGDEVPW